MCQARVEGMQKGTANVDGHHMVLLVQIYAGDGVQWDQKLFDTVLEHVAGKLGIDKFEDAHPAVLVEILVVAVIVAR